VQLGQVSMLFRLVTFKIVTLLNCMFIDTYSPLHLIHRPITVAFRPSYFAPAVAKNNFRSDAMQRIFGDSRNKNARSENPVLFYSRP
jgi:hypothetical protein